MNTTASRHLRAPWAFPCRGVVVVVSALALAMPLSVEAHSAALADEGSAEAVVTFLAGAATGPDDVWLVGTESPGAMRTVARHWDGSAWSTEQAQDPGTESNYFAAVDAVAPDDVWAVGAYASSKYSWSSMVQHYDGSSWSVLPVPYQKGYDQLVAVSAISEGDVWAAGETLDPLEGYLLHWNGKRWSTEGVRAGQYFDLSASSDTKVWTTYDGHPSKWNGSSWTEKYLSMGASSIAAIDQDDVWAAGYVGWSHSSRASFAHFDGTTWTQLAPDAPGHANQVRDLSAVASNDVWAVSQGLKNQSQIGQVLHWDGTSWSPVLRRTAFGGYLDGVVGVGRRDAWAFGLPHGQDSPINAMHWNGSRWKLYAIS